MKLIFIYYCRIWYTPYYGRIKQNASNANEITTSKSHTKAGLLFTPQGIQYTLILKNFAISHYYCWYRATSIISIIHCAFLYCLFPHASAASALGHAIRHSYRHVTLVILGLTTTRKIRISSERWWRVAVLFDDRAAFHFIFITGLRKRSLFDSHTLFSKTCHVSFLILNLSYQLYCYIRWENTAAL